MEKTNDKTIPIIALTANAFDEDVQRSLQVGLNAHLSKPAEPDVLFKAMESMIYLLLRKDRTKPRRAPPRREGRIKGTEEERYDIFDHWNTRIHHPAHQQPGYPVGNQGAHKDPAKLPPVPDGRYGLLRHRSPLK